jgi:hypothetical protein
MMTFEKSEHVDTEMFARGLLGLIKKKSQESVPRYVY